jgi:uncharacterized membrane protein
MEPTSAVTTLAAPGLALGAAAGFGAADFLGGLAARKRPAFAVVGLSQSVGLLAMVAAIGLLPRARPLPADLAWGAAAGLAGAVGLGLLYRALATGRMSVAAPVAAACGLALPVCFGVLLGERPGAAPLFGVALALGAVALLGRSASAAPRDDGRASAAMPATVPLAAASGLVGGAFYVLMQRTSADAGLWPLLAARATSVAVLGLVWAGRGPARPRLGATGDRGAALAAVGLLDTAGSALYLLAVHEGALSVVATLASLYPAATVLLARLVLGERLQRVQLAGLALALAAVGLLA